jgi:hypothetical protein
MGYPIETTTVPPPRDFDDEIGLMDMLEDLGDLPPDMASLVIERNIPADENGDRIER